MVLIAAQVYDHIEHALGGKPVLSMQAIANAAGRHLSSMHEWKYLEGRAALLSVRAKIEATGATWTEAGAILTKTAAFTNYTFVDGDKVKITAGTGIDAADREYFVKSRTDADNIVLETSIGSGANGQTDIAFTMENNSVLLPSDCGEIISYDATESLVNSLVLVDSQELLHNRTRQVLIHSWNLRGMITQHISSALATTPGKITRLLEIWPSVTTDDEDALTIFYRGDWVDIASDSDRIRIPDYVELLYIELCRRFAKGWEEEDVASLPERLEELTRSQLYMDVRSSDASIQPDYGEITGGAVEMISGAWDNGTTLRTTVSSPS